MKKLVCAALVAASMVAMADEAKKAESAPADAAKAAPVAARQQMTPEQRAEMRAKFEKMRAERKAQMEAKLLEVVKKYVPEEEKAKALLKELQEAMTANRRPPMGPRRPMPKSAVKDTKPAAEAK